MTTDVRINNTGPLHMSAGKWAAALGTKLRVVTALYLRETRTRFGRYRLGIIWSFAEPLVHVSGFLLLSALLGRAGPFSVPYALFLISGIVPFMLMRHCYTRVLTAIDVNRSLLVFPQVGFADLTLARVLLECLISTLVLVILLGGYAWIFGAFQAGDFPVAVLSYLLFPLLGTALGLFFRPLIAVFPVIGTLMNYVWRILYFSSGVMFSLSRLPDQALHFLSFNPVARLLETFRGGLFERYWIEPGFDDVRPVLLCAGALIVAGYMLERRFLRQIMSGTP